MPGLLAVVFTLERERAGVLRVVRFARGQLPKELSKSEIEACRLESLEKMLDHCRALLYDIYIKEQHWQPSVDVHTRFYIIASSVLEGHPMMLCDRYDEQGSVWFMMIEDSATHPIMGCFRAILGSFGVAKNDLDILGYDACPRGVREWVNAQSKPVCELQRIAFHRSLRQSHLLLYVYLVGSSVLGDYSLNLGTEGMLATYSGKGLVSFSTALGGETPDGWSFKYDPADPAPVFVIRGYPDTIYKRCFNVVTENIANL
jgi:hypothetical protein